MHKARLTFICLFIASFAFTQTKKIVPVSNKKPEAPVLKNAVDSMSYAIGILDANFFKQQGLTKVNPALIGRAYQDVLEGKNTLLTAEACDLTVRQQLQIYARQKSQVTIDAGTKFLEENRKKPGVQQTASGLQYEVIRMGTGVRPADTSVVRIDYEGFLVDGTKFESSRDRGQPLEYALNRLIPGWIEGVKLMPVGSRFKFFIPYNLAYGEAGSPPAIPGGAALIFDIELLGILK